MINPEFDTMLTKLRSLFSPEETEDENAIETDLAAASLMLEVCWSDHQVDDAEIAAVRRLLVDLYSINSDKATALIADAKTRLENAVGLHPYTSYLRDHLDEAERFDVICALWQLALADDRIDKFEEHTIRQAADLLYLSHSRFIEAKLRAKSRSDDA